MHIHNFSQLPINLNDQSNFELAFQLATSAFTGEEKLQALEIIRLRDVGGTTQPGIPSAELSNNPPNNKPEVRPPLKGSKAEKIKKLLEDGKTPKEIEIKIQKGGGKVTPGEIYTIKKRYSL